MIFLTSFVAGAWDFSLLEKAVGTIWYIVAFVALSPGSAVAGVWMWREKRLREKRLSESIKGGSREKK